jgi:hypothetical protein
VPQWNVKGGCYDYELTVATQDFIKPWPRLDDKIKYEKPNALVFGNDKKVDLLKTIKLENPEMALNTDEIVL